MRTEGKRGKSRYTERGKLKKKVMMREILLKKRAK